MMMMERDLLSVLLIYPRTFLHVFIVCLLLVGFLFCVTVFYYMLISCVSYFGAKYNDHVACDCDKTKPVSISGIILRY